MSPPRCPWCCSRRPHGQTTEMTKPADPATRAATTTFNVLGPVAVEHDGIGVSLGGPRQVAVLARLLIGLGQVVTMDQLVEAVWDGESPSRPEVTVRSYLSNLRRAIEPDRSRDRRKSCIESCTPGYRLEVDRVQLDAHRFETEVDDGRAALTAGDHDTGVELLERALARWRGGPYDGVLETTAVVGVRARLQERRLVAVESLTEARLARGEHAAVMPLLEADLAEHPLRERLTELAMLALYRNGRQSEALEVCSRLRRRLVDRLGIDPGPAIQTLERQILNHDVALRPPNSEPIMIGRPLQPAGVVGDRTPEGGPSSTLPSEPTPGAPSGATPIVRLEEGPVRRRLVSALGKGRGITVAVTGEPGSGKTVLASGLAQAAVDGLGTGEAMIGSPVEGLASVPLVAVARSRSTAADQEMWLWSQVFDRLSETSDTAGGIETSATAAIRMQDVVDRIRSVTQRRPVLIVLEDCHWADPASIETLLHLTEELADRPLGLVVTWRPTERIRPEVLQPLRRLARVPSLIRVELGGLDPDAIELLVEGEPPARSASARRLHQASAGNAAFVVELLAGLRDQSDGTDPGQALPLTTNLRELVRERVEGIHPKAFEVLSLAAVAGGPFSAELVAEAGGLEPALVDDVLERAATGALVSAAGRDRHNFRFIHPVVADVLRADVSGPRRARLHGRLGEIMARRGWPRRPVAGHLARAATADTARTAVRLALDEARTNVDPEVLTETAGIGRSALDALGSQPDAIGLEVETRCFLAQWARIRGDAEDWSRQAARARDRAAAADDADLLAAAVLAGTGPGAVDSALATIDRLGPPSAPLDALDALRAAVDDAPARWRPVLANRLAHLTGATPPAASRRASAGHDDDGAVRNLRLEQARLALHQGHWSPASPQRLDPSPLAARIEVLSALAVGERTEVDRLVEPAQDANSTVSLLGFESEITAGSVGAYLYPDPGAVEGRLRAVVNRVANRGFAPAAVIESLWSQLGWLGTAAARRHEPGSWVDGEIAVLDTVVTGAPSAAPVLTAARLAVAAAAGALDRPSEADLAAALELLRSLTSSVIIGPGGIVVCGPASYYAGCAAIALGRGAEATVLLDASEEHARALDAWSVTVRVGTQRARLADRSGDAGGAERHRLVARQATPTVRAGPPTTDSIGFQGFPNEVPAP